MKNVESRGRIDAGKRYVREHIASTALFLAGAASVSSLAYGATGYYIDDPKSNQEYEVGMQALEDAAHINSIQNTEIEGFNEVKTKLDQVAREMTSDGQFISLKNENYRYVDAMQAGALLGFFLPIFGAITKSGENDNIRRRKDRKLRQGLTQNI